MLTKDHIVVDAVDLPSLSTEPLHIPVLGSLTTRPAVIVLSQPQVKNLSMNRKESEKHDTTKGTQ